MKTDEILKRPYARRIVPDPDGGYTASIEEFPGCFAQGDSVEEAFLNLEAAAESWIDACQEMGRPIPSPRETPEYSGKVVLRMPRSLHKRAALQARLDDTSLNQFLVTAVAQYVGTIDRGVPGPTHRSEQRTHFHELYSAPPSAAYGTYWNLRTFALATSAFEGTGRDDVLGPLVEIAGIEAATIEAHGLPQNERRLSRLRPPEASHEFRSSITDLADVSGRGH